MRGKIKSRHNGIIKQLLSDSRYTILETGIIMRNGIEIGFTKQTELKLRNKQYVYIAYKGTQIKIHRIVFAKFLGELIPGYVIHHKDNDGLNNNVNNLEQVSQHENIYYRFA